MSTARTVTTTAAVPIGIAAFIVFALWFLMIRMPGSGRVSTPRSLPPGAESLTAALRQHVAYLAGTVGERNVPHYDGLVAAANYIDGQLRATGLRVERQTLEFDGRKCDNIEAELRGVTHPDEIVIVGAHYDSVLGSPGANDNGSGVAAVLELARRFSMLKIPRTIRFVFFTNEEPPYFNRGEMGSTAYARRSRERGENIVAMFSIETIGYFNDAKNSQQYPSPLSLIYPDRGDFIAFVGNVASRNLVRKSLALFRGEQLIHSEGAALPASLPGVAWSDHASFWEVGYQAVMVTDTAIFRYPHYHERTDTPDKVDYPRMTRVVLGLETVVRSLAG